MTTTTELETPENESAEKTPRIALVGSPNAGKTTVFNALTGLRAKTGNYPGVTVSRKLGIARLGGRDLVIEDLPGTYSLEPVSPDEQVVSDVLFGRLPGVEPPDNIVVVADATTLERSLILVGQALSVGKPAILVITMLDELQARGGNIDIPLLSKALGIPVVGVIGTRGIGLDEIKNLIAEPEKWKVPPVTPPEDASQRAAWISSILKAVLHKNPQRSVWTERVDRVLLHPVWGTVVFVLVMFFFFQMIFTWATPLQDAVSGVFDWLGDLTAQYVTNPVLSGLISEGILAGVGTVLQFLPQIVLLFFMISLLENVGYMSRAAFLMDRVMGRAGLEGRCFVSLLSSYACAVPGIMSTRTIPSAKDRIATMMVAPLVTCSARLPVFTLLVGTFVPSDLVWGFVNMQGLVMFGLYFLGSFSALVIAYILKKTSLKGETLPFYMEMPPYRLPGVKTILIQMWDSAKYFVRKAGTIILGVSVLVWILLNVPVVTPPAGSSDLEATSYQMEHSIAGSAGRFIQPVFEPLGFDWRINVALIGSVGAREVFVSTLGQIAAASDDSDDDQTIGDALAKQKNSDGTLVYTPPTVAAVLVFFVYALQCMSTVAIMRRETNSIKWPIFAFVYMFALAWIGGFIAHEITRLIVG